MTALAQSQTLGQFYASLFRIQSEVLAGQHPFLRLPQAAVERLAPSDNGNSSSVPTLHARGVNSQGNVPLPRPSAAHNVQVSSRAAFDPVLLDKSQELVRAELSLKRQRIDRLLREAVESKRASSKASKAEPTDGPNLIDPQEILVVATALVKPISAFGPPLIDPPASATSSFDENSYYSSQVNSWSSVSEEGEIAAEPEVDVTQLSAHTKASNAVSPATIATQTTANHAPGSSFAPGAQVPEHADTAEPLAIPQVIAPDDDDLRDESYSPPSADAFKPPPPAIDIDIEAIAPRGPRAMNNNYHNHQASTRNSIQEPRARDSESYSPPAPSVPLVRNHIAAPLAPQPSRVSPLTNLNPDFEDSIMHMPHNSMAAQTRGVSGQDANAQQKSNNKNNDTRRVKEQNKKQKGRDTRDLRSMGNPSSRNPNAGNQGVAQQPTENGRKRRRDGQEDRSRQVSGKRIAVAASPEPYIKPEPVSPPPFSAQPTSGTRADAPRRLVLRDDGRADIEVLSPRDAGNARTQSAIQQVAPDPDALTPRTHTFGQVAEAPALPSPFAQRRPLYNGSDLRRVASVQYAAQRPLSPSQDDARYLRLGVPRPVPMYEEQLQSPMQFRAPGRYGSPFEQLPDYQRQAMTDRYAMPPPPKRRIIVDENGEEWLAVPARSAQARQSVARDFGPEEPQMRYMPDTSYDPRLRYTAEPSYAREFSRQPSYMADAPYMRAASQMIERSRQHFQPQVIDLEEDVYQRMAPPPPPPPPPQIAQRPTRMMDEQLQHALNYQSQQRSRAASMQPMAPRQGDPYAQLAPQIPYTPQNPAMLHDRAYSARPNVAQQAPAMNGQEGYDPRFPVLSGYQTWR